MQRAVNSDDIDILESSGNALVNSIFEGDLQRKAFDKDYVKRKEQKEDARRARFIKQKYKKRAYFDDVLYHQHALYLLQKRQGMQVTKPTPQPTKLSESESEREEPKLPPPRRESFHRSSLKNTRLRLQSSFSTLSNSSLSSLRSSHLSISESPSSSDGSAKKSSHRQAMKKVTVNQEDSTESTADASVSVVETPKPANIALPRRQSMAGKLTSRLTRRLSSAQALGRRKSLSNNLLLQSLDQAGTANPSSSTMTRVQRRKSQAMLKLGSTLETPAPCQPASRHLTEHSSIEASQTLETKPTACSSTFSYTPTRVTSLALIAPASKPPCKETAPETREEDHALGPREFRVGDVIRVLHQPAYNEQRFDSRIEQDLGYRVHDVYFREEIADLVYNPKPQAQFGFDSSIPGAKKGSVPLVQVVDFYSGCAAGLGVDADCDDSESVATNKSLGMPKNNSQLDLLMARAGMSYGDLSEANSSHRALTTPQA